MNDNNIKNIEQLKVLPKLGMLYLKGNEITNINVIADIETLEFLELTASKIKDLSPLVKLPKLRVLMLDGVTADNARSLFGLNVSGTFELTNSQIDPVDYGNIFGQMNELTDLNLQHNNISDINNLIDSLPNKRKLSTLDISYNKIQHIEKINKELESLIFLVLNDNQILDIGSLEGIQLKWLDAHNNNISDFTVISSLPELKLLTLSNTGMKELPPLEELVNLEMLNISNNSISDITPLSELKNLKDLDLAGNNIKDLLPLKDLINLELLYLKDNEIVEVSQLSSLKNLKHVDLRGNKIEDYTPIDFVEEVMK